MEEYVEDLTGRKFLLINPSEYVQSRVDHAFVGSKFASVTIEQGHVGQKVATIMKDGFSETINTISYDIETGEPDWIVTQASGEKMVVTDKKVHNLYQVEGEIKEGEQIQPSGVYRPMIRVDEDVALYTSWGELQYIRKGGVLVVLGEKDIYGIQKDEFEGSYNIVKEEDGKALMSENLQKVDTPTQKPTIFLSVAYPHDDKQNQKLLKEIIKYVNSNGLRAINIKKIDPTNTELLSEISKAIETSEGVLSLAFNKGDGHTSPFVQIEGAFAAAMGLSSLMIVPEGVKREGVLFDDGKANIIEIQDSKSLYSKQNKGLLDALDNFIVEIYKRASNKLTQEELLRFKKDLSSDESEKAQTRLLDFIKKRYSVKNANFDLKDIYVKRPTQIKAIVVEEGGTFKTKDGEVFLQKGDFLVNDKDGEVYGVSRENFEARYVKVENQKDVYLTKIIPTIAKKEGDMTEVCQLIDMEDKYSMSAERFEQGYLPLEDFILNNCNFQEIEDSALQELE